MPCGDLQRFASSVMLTLCKRYACATVCKYCDWVGATAFRFQLSVGHIENLRCNLRMCSFTVRVCALLCPCYCGRVTGTFANVPGSNRCSPCPLGSFQEFTGQASCRPCVPGAFCGVLNGTVLPSVCEAGYACPPGSSEQTPCASGSMSYRGSSACTNCLAGFIEQSHLRCQRCVVGKHAPSPGSAACKDCAPGRFAATDAAISCSYCAPGTYQNVSGQGACARCAEGSYSAVWGRATCGTCAPGQKSNGTACLDCTPGRFAATPLSYCTQCKAGQFAASSRSPSCTGVCVVVLRPQLAGH
jgi:hypothetical protein